MVLWLLFWIFADRLFKLSNKGYKLSDKILENNVVTLMVAGYDTSATGTSHALYCLASNQDVQEKVIIEIDSIFGLDQGQFWKKYHSYLRQSHVGQ